MKLDLKTKAILKRTPIYKLYKRKKNKTEVLFDKNHTWIFNAGNQFAGNPKWLFLYVTKYRKDIDAYWYCDSEETVEFVRSLGYKAYTYDEWEGSGIKQRAGVFVVENVKEAIPPYMEEAKMINLFHGVGVKSIERRLTSGFLNERIIKKYIEHNQYYRNNQLFLVTSPFMEKHFMYQCGIDEDKVIRAGYPRCLYQKYCERVQTFDHDIRKKKGLDKNCRIAAYVPTYRDSVKSGGFFRKALPDMERLIERLSEINMLMIFKMHPLVANTLEYQQIMKKYSDNPYLYFWDNNDDFYEIFDQIDVGIIDYSSIYYDMLEGGTKGFIRYFYDFNDEDAFRELVYDVKEMTSGPLCETFDQLLEMLGEKDLADDEEKTARIRDLFWSYSDENSLDKIVEAALAFEPETDRELPVLHSFDIFDTLISRKVLDPKGIFYGVMDSVRKSDIPFPSEFSVRYPQIRTNAEENVRDYYRKNVHRRADNRREVKFQWIFDKIRQIHSLNDEQIKFLMDEEMRIELDNCIPCPDKIVQLKECLEQGQDVVLISDMYHDREFIMKLLEKADPELTRLPLYLSSETGVQKTTKLLFMELYHSIENYIYKEWIHHGDNPIADSRRPAELGIKPDVHVIPTINEYEEKMFEYINSYDGILLAASFARFRYENQNPRDYFAYAYTAAYFVPYIYWVIQDALKKGYKTLYFISRDGHHLKRIADTFIRMGGYDLKTKYIYGSRRVWRIPSFVDHVDDDFFGVYGSFAGIESYEGILKALNLDDEAFKDMFPELADLSESEEQFTRRIVRLVSETARNSEKYHDYLLALAKERREIILDYFRQEMDFDEPYAFVEYWGRGYTQECHKRLIDCTVGYEKDLPYYYVRSINGTEGGNIRYNYTEDMYSMIYVESLFANIPYKSIEHYQWSGDKVVPVIEPITCDEALFDSMERSLVKFTEDIMSISFNDTEQVLKDYFHFGMNYFKENPDDPLVAENLGALVDAVGTYSAKKEFAPKFTPEMLDGVENGDRFKLYTQSQDMSAVRSDPDMRLRYFYLTEIFPEKKEAMKKEERYQASLDRQAKSALATINSKLSDRIGQNDRYKKLLKQSVIKDKTVVFQKTDRIDPGRIYSLLKAITGVDEKGRLLDEGKVVYYTDKDKITQDMLKNIATAEFIILTYNAGIISNLNIRPETKVIQLWYDAFQYLNSGLARKQAVDRPEIMKKEKTLRNYRVDAYPVGSEESGSLFRRFIHKRNAGSIINTGSPITDIYFDDRFKEQQKDRLVQIFPGAKGKKVILFAPASRKRENKASILTLFNTEELKKTLGDEYVFVVYCKKDALEAHETYTIPASMRDFAADVTDLMSEREIMCCADIIIGDYTNVFFESVLLNKPIFLSNEDQENYESTKDVSLPYDNVRLGPSVYDTRDLINAIQAIDDYNYTASKQFCRTYFADCDGKSSERLLSRLRG